MAFLSAAATTALLACIALWDTQYKAANVWTTALRPDCHGTSVMAVRPLSIISAEILWLLTAGVSVLIRARCIRSLSHARRCDQSGLFIIIIIKNVHDYSDNIAKT